MMNRIECDVLVVGAGPAGFIAAASAAREGVDVILMERYGFIGGMLSAGEVRNIRNPNDGNGNFIVGDLPREYFDLLDKYGGAYRNPLANDFIQQNPEITKYVSEILCLKYGVKLMYHSVACEAIMKGNRISGVRRFSKDGYVDIYAKTVVDATGDGDIAYMAGAEYEKDEILQPMTTTFLLGGVNSNDWSRTLVLNKESYAKLRDLQKHGLYPVPRDDLSAFTTQRDGEVYMNVTRYAGDCTKESDLTAGEIACRKQIMECIAFLKEHIPEFKDCYLIRIAPQIGLRESRRIIGKYTMTKEDIMNGNMFDDTIALGSYIIDIHHTDKTTTHIKLPKGVIHKIPYRCLIPVSIEGLIMAGRCISSTKEAHGAIRVMATCMGIGQAAGTAAAISVLDNVVPDKIDSDILRGQLLKYNVPI